MSGAGLLTGDALGTAARGDPGLAPPLHPRMADGIEMVVFASGLALLNGWQPAVLRGPAARAFFPRLLAALDGRATAAELVDLLEVPEAAVDNALVLLRAAGVLEDGAPAGDTDELARWLSRSADSVRAHPSGAVAAAALRATRVGVVGQEHAAEMLIDSLGSCGIHAAPMDPAAADFVVALVVGEEPVAQLRAIDSACADRQLPWLRVVCSADRLELGPVFIRGCAPCYTCFSLSSRPQGSVESAAPAPEDLRVWMEVASLEVIALTGRALVEASGLRVCVVDRDWTIDHRTPTRMKGCGRCGLGPPGGEPEGTFSPALRMEAADARPPVRLRNLRASVTPYLPRLRELEEQLRVHPGAEHVQLPALRLDRAARQSRRPLTVAEIATLLATAYGLRAPGAVTDRYAPTAGNLGSAEAFVIAWHVEGLQSGLYAYEPRRHRLARLRRPPDFIKTAITRLDMRDGAAAIVQVGARGRLAAKYGALANRLVHLDAGVALGQLKSVARGLGIDVITGAGNGGPPPDTLAAFLRTPLGLDVDEPVTAVLGLQRGGVPNREAGAGLTTFLRTRRSVRVFRPSELDRDLAARVLAAAVAGGLAVRLVAARIAGMDAGVYAPMGSTSSLAKLAPLPSPDLWPQLEFASAPAIVVVVGDLSSDDERAIAAQLRRAGEAGYAADRAARREGLGGCFFPGPVGMEAAGLGCDGYATAPLLGYAFGSPAQVA